MDDEVFYLLTCLQCGDPERPLPIPFESPAERGKWASGHTKATGHDRWWVKDQPRTWAQNVTGEPTVLRAASVIEVRDPS